MARASRSPTVLRVDGPIILDWGNGLRLQIAPLGSGPTPAGAPDRRAGRPPSPATQTLREAMERDAAAKAPQPRETYIRLLQASGGPASRNAAGIVVNREAKRFFGGSLPRGKARSRGRTKRGGGRAPLPATEELRTKLADDKAKGDLRDAPHYIRWLVDQAGIGLKRARPVVYRELRAIR